MSEIERVGILGAGVIGSSWTALFLAAGYEVDVYEPHENGEQNVRKFIENAWPTLDELGMTASGNPNNIHFHNNANDAVKNVQFVQENVPEQLPLKHQLYQQIESSLATEAIVASSASGLMVSEMQKGWKDPSRFILGHPFNPPHLIPLVELLANENTADGVLECAEAFYKNAGKITIQVKREVPAHVANRLQAALWREAISLVENGVASVEDVDKAVWAGPGLRWSAMGPHMLFHLGAGAGGLEEFCHRYKDSFHRWWDNLDDVRLTENVTHNLSTGVSDEAGSKSVEALSQQRDALIVAMLKNSRSLR